MRRSSTTETVVPYSRHRRRRHRARRPPHGRVFPCLEHILICFWFYFWIAGTFTLPPLCPSAALVLPISPLGFRSIRTHPARFATHCGFIALVYLCTSIPPFPTPVRLLLHTLSCYSCHFRTPTFALNSSLSMWLVHLDVGNSCTNRRLIAAESDVLGWGASSAHGRGVKPKPYDVALLEGLFDIVGPLHVVDVVHSPCRFDPVQ